MCLRGRGKIHNLEHSDSLRLQRNHIGTLILREHRWVYHAVIDALPLNLIEGHCLVRLISTNGGLNNLDLRHLRRRVCHLVESGGNCANVDIGSGGSGVIELIGIVGESQQEQVLGLAEDVNLAGLCGEAN